MFIYEQLSGHDRKAGETNQVFTENDIGVVFTTEISVVGNPFKQTKKLKVLGVKPHEDKVLVTILVN